MPRIDQSALLPYSPGDLFAMVDDVESYPAFVPGVKSARLIERTPEAVTAELTLSRGGVSVTFTTRNLRFPDERLEMELLDGPLKSLDGVWVFKPLGDAGCRVSLVLNFQMHGGLFAKPAEALIGSAVGRLVDAFSQRAHEVLGEA